MLTDYQRQLFNDLVSLNWEINQCNSGYNEIVMNALITQYWKVRDSLIEDMGRDKYNDYIGGMRQMFAPAK
jgi:hypothetical protein